MVVDQRLMMAWVYVEVAAKRLNTIAQGFSPGLIEAEKAP
jgi:hypothetical protein